MEAYGKHKIRANLLPFANDFGALIERLLSLLYPATISATQPR